MTKELVILTGVSGAGKSTAMAFFEDIGYYCIDNMPPMLISTFVGLLENRDEYKKIAIVTDIRNIDAFDRITGFHEELKKTNYEVKIIYLDLKIPVALKRYKLTRRKHPLADKYNGNIEAAIKKEKQMLKPIRSMADYVIDTSNMQQNMLRERLSQILTGDNTGLMNVHCMSFGFKHGIPTDADFVLDVRCLPNPYWVEDLREKTGLDKEIVDYVFSFDDANTLFDKLSDMVDFLIPLYTKEGKSQLVIAIGCTGGNHRSVAFAEKLKKHLKKQYKNVTSNHRDIDKK